MRARYLLLAGLILSLGGCGQKGSLYLPDAGEVVTTTAAPAAAPAPTPGPAGEPDAAQAPDETRTNRRN